LDNIINWVLSNPRNLVLVVFLTVSICILILALIKRHGGALSWFSILLLAPCYILCILGLYLLDQSILSLTNLTETQLFERCFDHGALFLSFGFAGIIYAVSLLLSISFTQSTEKKIEEMSKDITKIKDILEGKSDDDGVSTNQTQ